MSGTCGNKITMIELHFMAQKVAHASTYGTCCSNPAHAKQCIKVILGKDATYIAFHIGYMVSVRSYYCISKVISCNNYWIIKAAQHVVLVLGKIVLIFPT